MRRFLLTLTVAATVLTAGALVPRGASATPLSAPAGLALVLAGMGQACMSAAIATGADTAGTAVATDIRTKVA